MKKFFTNSTNTPKSKVTSLAIGTFDGLHIAHQKLFSHLDDGGAIFVVTKNITRLTPGRIREQFCKRPIFYVNIDDISSLSAKSFLDLLVEEFTNLKKIVVGYDFRFGKNRTGNIDFLKNYFNKEVIVVDEVFYDGSSVHASLIVSLIESGEIKKANAMLGRAHTITGKIVKGQGLGRAKLFPTINIDIVNFALPKEGVYVGNTYIEGEIYHSVNFVGHRLSTDGNFSIESHILNKSIGKLKQGANVRMSFVDKLRNNLKFDSLDELKAQIAKDIQMAKDFFST